MQLSLLTNLDAMHALVAILSLPFSHRMTMVCWIAFLFISFLSLSHASAITIIKNPLFAQEKIKSFYSTIGIPPLVTYHSHPIYLSHFNFSDDCWFSSSTNVSLLEESIIIITSLPEWFDCTSESTGVITGVSRLLHKVGAMGIVVTQQEQVLIIFNYLCFLKKYICSIWMEL